MYKSQREEAAAWKRLVVVMLCLGLCLAATLRAWAAEAKAPLKVGYDVTGVLLRKTKQGIYRGYNVEFLYEIAKYTNWDYEYVPFETWDGALKALAAGEIDILPTVLRSPARDQTMLFANHWMGMIHVALVVPKDDRQHFYGDLDSLQGLRIGIRQNTKDAEDVKKWVAEANLKHQLFVYSDNKELLEALDEGKIDAAGLSYIGRARKYRAVVEFAPQEMYFAISPKRSDIKIQMDAAMSQISAFNPEFFSNAMDKLTGRETNPLPVFSLKEQAFIDGNKPIRITFLRQAPPFSYVDGNNQYLGLLPKLLERITALSGLQFSFVPVDSPAEALKAVQEGRADVVGRITNNLFFAKQEKLRLTTPYTYLPLVQVTLPETRNIQRVAMQEHCQMDLIQDLECATPQPAQEAGADTVNGKTKFKLYPNAKAMFQALAAGTVDAVYCDAFTAGHFMELRASSTYKPTVLQPYMYSFSLGVGMQGDMRLATILDKCIRCISVKEIDEMFLQSRIEDSASLKTTLERLPTTYLAAFAVFLLALIIGLAISLVRLRRQAREKLAIQEQVAATEQEKLRLEGLEKSAEEKNQFFANISHDMRTPLNAIIGLSQLADKEPVSEQVRDYLDKIHASGTLLLSLINDTLNISKLNSGKVVLKMEPVACEDLFTDVVVPIQAAAEAKQIHFSADRSGATCKYILADRVNLEKIILNLLTNAVKYTPPGGHISFTVKKELRAADDAQMVIQVQDDGIGMAPEFLPHIYDTFSQENDGGSGTGLGMAIVKRLVDLMAGTIDVVSSKGQGTTFTVCLPVKEAEAPTAAAAAVSEADLALLQGAQVLLCEDNELNRQIAKALLERQGMQVVIAENGKRGVELFQASKEFAFTVILMDVRMPVLGGLEATAQIRSLPRQDAAQVPIIAMTANTFPEDIAACLQAGMNAHVGKPINPQTLYLTLSECMQRKKST